MSFYNAICIEIAYKFRLRLHDRGGGAFSDLASKDTPGRLQEHGRLLERLRYVIDFFFVIFSFLHTTKWLI